jgi:hypothetical protein
MSANRVFAALPWEAGYEKISLAVGCNAERFMKTMGLLGLPWWRRLGRLSPEQQGTIFDRAPSTQRSIAASEKLPLGLTNGQQMKSTKKAAYSLRNWERSCLSRSNPWTLKAIQQKLPKPLPS